MAFLIDIGTGIVGKLVELTFVPVGRQVGYLIYYNRNVKSLADQLDDLVAARQSVEQRVAEEKKNIREVEVPVNKWLTDVEKIAGEAKEILNEEHKVKKKWLCGLCPNLIARHQLSRRSTKLVADVAELYGKKDFSTFAHATTPQDVPTKDYEAFGSRTSVVNQIMDVLRNSPDIDMIGVYGIGGVGKTTLVKEVARQATGDKTLFDDVALILDVKQNPSIQRIQKEIAEKLGLDLPESETTTGRARRLSGRIKDQKTLVILDDVWERIDLEAVGLSGVANCKVLLTSRSREVLSGEMQTRKEIPLALLGKEETWSLFEKKAGDVIKDPAIKTVAIKVAKRCGGLPVLVVTVASALKNRSTLHAWNDALRRLKRFEKEEFTEKTYLALEWSYSQLNDEELKQLFLLFGLLANPWKSIYIHDLFKYSIGLGLFKNLHTLGEAWDVLNTMLEKLKDSCLLLDHEDSGWAKMHDLVHDVAKRISSRDQHMWKVTDGDEFKEWSDKDFFEKCSMIFVTASNIPELPEVLKCKELQLFYLGPPVEDYYSIDIPANFFEETTKLRVLDLTGLSIPSLPPSLRFLKSLKTLCLDGCILGDIALIGQLQSLEVLSFLHSQFKEFPKEIGQLTRLRLLDLTGCSQLKLISPGVISNLERLEELRMGNSFNRWEAEGVIGTEKINASLSELKHLSKLSTLYIHILDATILPSNLFSNALERFQIYIGATWNWNIFEDTDLNKLKIKLTAGNELYQSGLNMLLKRTDELHLDGTEAGNNSAYQLDGEAFQQLKHLHVHNAEFRHIINGKGVSPNLKKLVVSGLDDSRFLLTSSMARSLVQLTHLEVSGCQTMEEIISTNKSDEKHMKNMFSKLQHLVLKDLPILTSFCSIRYTGIPSLEILQLENDNEIEERESKENLGDALFDEKVVFPSLKRLFISGLTKIMTIWQNQRSLESFKNLETISINSCKSLKSVFPYSMVTSLAQLINLKVVDCGVEEIVANEDEVQATPEFVFPKVDYVLFQKLPHLCCFYPGMHASSWPSLETLMVFDCSKVAFLAQECSSFERNRESVLLTPTSQALFLINKGVSPNLNKLVVSGIGSKFLLSSSMARSLVQLTHLEISGCQTMEEIISTNETDEMHMQDMFSKLQHLVLKDLPIITSFCSIRYTGIPSLEILQLENDDEIEQRDFREEVGNALFDEKVVFPSLKRLIISGLTKIMTIWHNQLSPESFRNLETLKLNSCKSLKSVFPCSMVTSLEQLMYLEVVDCGVEEIVANEDEVQATPEFVFRKVGNVLFQKLPHLCCFYPKMHASSWPSLETLRVVDCSKVAFLAQKCSSFERNRESVLLTPTSQALFLINKDSFPNLKKVIMLGMEIWEGPFPVNFFSKLEFFQEGNQQSESAAILEKFPNAVGALPHLTQLWLHGMPKLKHLGEDNSQIAGQNFPNLTLLGIDGCVSLKNLRSSAISFKNLKKLQVNGCSGLEYLLNYTTAKSLMQLQLLSVENCARLVEIVGSTDQDNDDSGNEIVFSRLEYLKLSYLPKLRGFCSRDHCIVKFPLLKTLSISKRLKLKIFHYNETLLVTNEKDDTDVDSDVGETVAKENVDIDTGDAGEQIDEITHITNGKEDENCDRSEHVQTLEITSTDQGVIETEEENPTIIPVGEVVGEQASSGPNLEPLAEETRHVQEQSDLFEPAATGTPLPITRALAPPSSSKSSGPIRSLKEKFQAMSAEKVDIVQTGASCEEIGETTDANFDGPEHVQPHKNITANDHRVIAPVDEENLAIVPIGEITTPVILVTEPPLVAEVPHIGEVGKQAFSGPNLEPPAKEARPNEHQIPKAPEQPVEEQSDPFEPSAAAIETPTPIFRPLAPQSFPKLSEVKRSLREKLQALSAKKAASSSCMPEEAKAKLKALIATADLKDPHARQQLLAVLPTLQLSSAKWIADLVVQELSELPLVLDKEELLCHELAALKAQGAELDERSHILLSEGSLAEESIQKVEEQKVELLALEEKMKKLEAQATSLRDEIAIGEKRYSSFEASLDQLFEEQQLNQLSVDSTSQELLRTRAVSDSLCTAIFTHLRQLF